MEKYVIAIKAYKDVMGKPCEEWRYAGISSTYPCWTYSTYDCKIFADVESAKRWFNEHKKYLLDLDYYYRFKLDDTTLSIQQIVLKKVASLSPKIE